MKNKLFISKQLTEPSTKRSHNHINGNDAEVLCASNLIQALNAEVRWGSRNEDNSKIDLLISFKHPWSNDNILLLAQVKSGNSYGAIENGKYFKLKTRSIKEIQRGLSTILLVWLDQTTSKCYWANIEPNTKPKPMKYGANHLVSPAARYELARIFSWKINKNQIGGRGIVLKNDFSNPLSLERRRIKIMYKSIKEIKSPLLGKIELTNLGWNHMFRSGRKRDYKKHSLFIIPYLKIILKRMPNKYWINKFEKYTRLNFEFLQYEYVMKYKNFNSVNGNRYEVVIKVIEEVGYPKKWEKETFLTQKIMRRVILKSCSLKRE